MIKHRAFECLFLITTQFVKQLYFSFQSGINNDLFKVKQLYLGLHVPWILYIGT